jgi:hypothetical protein
MIPCVPKPAPWGGAALALLLSSLPALAEDGPRSGPDLYAWGSEVVAYVQMMPGEDHPATVVFVNRLTYHPREDTITLSIDGLVVAVEMLMGDGEEPDAIRVLPLAGFVAEPEVLEVGEDETGRVEVRYVPMS